jgi:hypothetical protein
VLPDASTGGILKLQRENGHGARRVWHVFLQSWHNFNLRDGAIAVQTKVRPLLSHDTGLCSKALAQYRGTNLAEAAFDSRYRSVPAGR